MLDITQVNNKITRKKERITVPHCKNSSKIQETNNRNNVYAPNNTLTVLKWYRQVYKKELYVANDLLLVKWGFPHVNTMPTITYHWVSSVVVNATTTQYMITLTFMSCYMHFCKKNSGGVQLAWWIHDW